MVNLKGGLENCDSLLELKLVKESCSFSKSNDGFLDLYLNQELNVEAGSNKPEGKVTFIE
jgi:hypothetical protein